MALVAAATRASREDGGLPAADAKAGGVLPVPKRRPEEEGGQEAVSGLPDSHQGESGLHRPFELVGAEVAAAQKARHEALAGPRGLEHLGHGAGELLKIISLEQGGADQKNGTQRVPSGGKVGTLGGLGDPRRQGGLDDTRPREERGDDGALTDANDELGAARADAPGNGGDSGKSVATQALPVLDGVGPANGRGEPRLAAKALVN